MYYNRKQDNERALQCFRNVLLQNPQNSDARGAIGMIYHLQGNIARAISEYQQALACSDANILINELLEEALAIHSFDDQTGALKDGAFDISQIANIISDSRDEIEKELSENGRGVISTSANYHISKLSHLIILPVLQTCFGD